MWMKSLDTRRSCRRLLQLQEKKSAMINATLSTDESAMGRLTPEDVSDRVNSL